MVGWGGNKGVPTFPKAINPKVNVGAWVEIELAHYDVAIQLVSN